MEKVTFYKANEMYQRGSLIVVQEFVQNVESGRFIVRGFGSTLGDYKTINGWAKRANTNAVFFAAESITAALEFIHFEPEQEVAA